MKSFNVEDAKKEIIKMHEEIKTIERFIEIAESYNDEGVFEKKVIKEYAFIGNVAKVATKLNEMGYNLETRKLNSNDISAIIQEKPMDELHKIVRESFKNRRKAVNKRYN